jgi:anti-anti-sigma regulatory factor
MGQGGDFRAVPLEVVAEQARAVIRPLRDSGYHHTEQFRVAVYPMSAEIWSIVKLSGVIDIRSIDNSFTKVKQAAADGASIEIDLTDVVDIDLTFLQLIESARRSAAQAGAEIRLSQPAEGIILDTLKRGGFLNDSADERARFWLGQTGQTP